MPRHAGKENDFEPEFTAKPRNYSTPKGGKILDMDLDTLNMPERHKGGNYDHIRRSIEYSKVLQK